MDKPGVGVAAVVQHPDNRGMILLGLRAGGHGAGQWSFPGGKMDLWETACATAVRETEEETGLRLLDPVTLSLFTEDHFPEERMHFITLFVRGTAMNPGELETKEPDACRFWRWVPQWALYGGSYEGYPIWAPIRQLVERHGILGWLQ